MNWWMYTAWAGLVVGSALGGMEAGAWLKHLAGRRRRQEQEEECEQAWARPIDHIVVTGGGLGSPKTLRIDGDQFLTGAAHDLDHGTLTLDLMANMVEVVYADTLPSWHGEEEGPDE